MTTQHTPGPWHWDGSYARRDNSRIIKVVNGPASGNWVAAALDFNRDDRDDEVNANAHLIAAAPDLLASCQFALDWVNRIGEHAPIQFGGEAEVAAQLRASIAKAEGQ